MLLSRLSVKSDLLRTYMIEITYTGKDSALAAVVANAFVAKFLRSCKLQMLSEQRSLAEAALSRALAMFGDKHPRVIHAKMRLAATDNLMKEQLSERSRGAPASCRRNKAITASASPNPRFVISLLLLPTDRASLQGDQSGAAALSSRNPTSGAIHTMGHGLDGKI